VRVTVRRMAEAPDDLLASIDRIESHQHGEYIITLRDGARLTSSRAHSERLRELMKSSDSDPS